MTETTDQIQDHSVAEKSQVDRIEKSVRELLMRMDRLEKLVMKIGEGE